MERPARRAVPSAWCVMRRGPHEAHAASRGRMAEIDRTSAVGPAPPGVRRCGRRPGVPASVCGSEHGGDVHLGRPTLVRAVTDHLFEPADGRLGAYSTHGEHRFHAMAGTNFRPSRAGSSADLIMESGTWLASSVADQPKRCARDPRRRPAWFSTICLVGRRLPPCAVAGRPFDTQDSGDRTPDHWTFRPSGLWFSTSLRRASIVVRSHSWFRA
jgi:hypothetical protein